jgi:hypothetical protein
MSEIEGFFEELNRRGREPMLAKVHGTLRFDLLHGAQVDHWLVTIDDGRVQVRQDEREADCALRTERALFARIVSGETNAEAAWLRHVLTISGDHPQLFHFFQRVFPGPSDARHPRSLTQVDGRLPS